MVDFAAASDGEENPATDLDSDEVEDLDEEADGDVNDDVSPEELVYLEWADEYGIPGKTELPVKEAVEENAKYLTDSTVSPARVDDLAKEVEAVREENQELREENENLRERIDSLQGWKGSVVGRLNETSENVRLLLTASDLDVSGVCPECKDAPLETVTGFSENNRIECSGEDCDHVAAELE